MKLSRKIKLMFSKIFGLRATKKQEFNNVEHRYDETQYCTGGCWVNLHGYKTEDNIFYVGADYRWLGIRIQNVVIKCGSMSSYEKWLRYGIQKTDSFHELVTNNLDHTSGDTDTCFTFNTTDGKSKYYNIDQFGDVYAWVD